MNASPSYGDRPPLHGGRRSLNPPPRSLSVHEKAGLDASDASAQVYHTHPNVKIYYFSPPKEYIRSTSDEKLPPETDYPIDTIETLPWRTRVERLMASGTMVIEKVRGSTKFIKCEAVSYAIMRNSQCWCVDGESKFVLRIRQFEYYRIEVPSQTEEDKQRVEALKATFEQHFRYENTPCPFKRGFTVDLPDDAITPRRRGTWTRRDSSQTGLSDSETPSRRPLENGRRVGMRSPPTSFPRNSPHYGSPLSVNSPGSSIGFDTDHQEQSPLNATNSIGIGYIDQEMEHPRINRVNGTAADAPKSGEERGRPVMSRQASTTVPVSVRVASIERSKQQNHDLALIERKPLSIDTTPAKNRSSGSSPVSGQNEAQVHTKQLSVSPLRSMRSPSVEDTESLGDTESHGRNSSPGSVELVPEETGRRGSTIVINKRSLSDLPTDVEPAAELEEGLESTETGVEDLPVGTKDTVDHTAQTPDSVVSSDDAELNTVVVAPEEHGDDDSGVQLQEGPPSEAVTGGEGDVLAESISGLRADESEHSHTTMTEKDKRNFVNDEVDLSGDGDGDGNRSIAPPTVSLPTTTSNEDIESENQVVADPKSILKEPQSLLEEPKSVSEVPEPQLVLEEDEDDAVSVISSADSFHTLSSNIRRTESEVDPDFDKTPVNQYLDPFARPGWQHRREMSEMTVTGSTAASRFDSETTLQDHDAASSSSTTTPVASIHPEVNLGLRQRLRARRSFSPMPPSSIITNNPPSSSRIGNTARNRELAKAVLQTVLVKPIEVAVFVVHILARIAQGATPSDLISGDLFRRPEHQRRVSGFADQLNGSSRNSHNRNESGDADVEDDDFDGTRLDEDQLDDFGMPIRGRERVQSARSHTVTGRNNHNPTRDDDAESFVSVD